MTLIGRRKERIKEKHFELVILTKKKSNEDECKKVGNHDGEKTSNIYCSEYNGRELVQMNVFKYVGSVKLP